MEKEQTAVEWYDNEINKLVSMLITNQLSISRFNDLQRKALNIANQLFKEQIIDAADYGPDYNKAEDYYKSKYGTNE